MCQLASENPQFSRCVSVAHDAALLMSQDGLTHICLVAYIAGVRIGQMHRMRHLWEESPTPQTSPDADYVDRTLFLTPFFVLFDEELLTPSISELSREFLDKRTRVEVEERLATVTELISDMGVYEERLRGAAVPPMHEATFRDATFALRRAVNSLKRAVRSSLPDTGTGRSDSRLWFDLGVSISDARASEATRKGRGNAPCSTSYEYLAFLWESPSIVARLLAEVGVSYDALVPPTCERVETDPVSFVSLEVLQDHVPLGFWMCLEAGFVDVGKTVSPDGTGLEEARSGQEDGPKPHGYLGLATDASRFLVYRQGFVEPADFARRRLAWEVFQILLKNESSFIASEALHPAWATAGRTPVPQSRNVNDCIRDINKLLRPLEVGVVHHSGSRRLEVISTA